MAPTLKATHAEIRVADQTYHIVLDMNALCDLEDLLGKSVHEAFFSSTMSMTALRGALYVGLRRRHRAMTQKEVGNILSRHPERLKEYTAAVYQALLSAQGESADTIEQFVTTIRGEGEEGEEQDAPL